MKVTKVQFWLKSSIYLLRIRSEHAFKRIIQTFKPVIVRKNYYSFILFRFFLRGAVEEYDQNVYWTSHEILTLR